MGHEYTLQDVIDLDEEYRRRFPGEKPVGVPFGLSDWPSAFCEVARRCIDTGKPFDPEDETLPWAERNKEARRLMAEHPDWAID